MTNSQPGACPARDDLMSETEYTYSCSECGITWQGVQTHGITECVKNLKQQKSQMLAALLRIVPGLEYLIESGVTEKDFIFADALNEARAAIDAAKDE